MANYQIWKEHQENGFLGISKENCSEEDFFRISNILDDRFTNNASVQEIFKKYNKYQDKSQFLDLTSFSRRRGSLKDFLKTQENPCCTEELSRSGTMLFLKDGENKNFYFAKNKDAIDVVNRYNLIYLKGNGWLFKGCLNIGGEKTVVETSLKTLLKLKREGLLKKGMYLEKNKKYRLYE